MQVRERRHEAGGRLCRLNPAVVLLAGAVLMAAATASAAVLCAKPRKDGTFNTGVKIREACKPGEVQLDAAAVGLCCTVTTTTTSGTTATTCPPTTTTTSLPLCSPSMPSSCLVGVCSNGNSCAPDAVTGDCGCTGPPPSCGAYGTQFCGGTCSEGSTCQIVSLPPTACFGVQHVCRCVPTP